MVVPMILALVFDFDGLILDTETPILDAWEQVHTDAGLACVRQEAMDLIGEVDHDYDLWRAFGPGADRHALKLEHRRLTREFLLTQPLLPGVQDRLDEARQLGLLLAIASNSSSNWVARNLPRLGLKEYFPRSIAGTMSRAANPNPTSTSRYWRRSASKRTRPSHLKIQALAASPPNARACTVSPCRTIAHATTTSRTPICASPRSQRFRSASWSRDGPSKDPREREGLRGHSFLLPL
jgi:hypothetical protein